jgi:mono/diheme cytochrome c family protein
MPRAALWMSIAFFCAAGVAGADARTERVWKSKCASCHGADGRADNDIGRKQAIRDMTTASWQAAFTDAQLRDATLDGLHRTRDGKQQDMDGYRGKLSDEQVAALVAYMRALKK